MANAPRIDGPTLAALVFSGIDKLTIARIATAMMIALLIGSVAACAPLTLQMLIDSHAAGGEPTGTALFGLGYVGVLALGRALDPIQAYAFATADQRFQRSLSSRTFQKVLDLPLSYHLDQPVGGLMQTVSLGLQGARLWLTHATFSILPLCAQFSVIVIVAVHALDQGLLVSLAGAMALYALAFVWAVRRLRKPTRHIIDVQAKASAFVADAIVNVEAIKSFVGEHQMNHQYEELLAEGEKRWRTFHARRLENGLVVTATFATAIGAALWAGVDSYIAGRTTTGEFVLLNSYLLQLVRPMEMAGFAVRDLAQGAAYLQRWAEMMRRAGEGTTRERSDVGAPWRGLPSIRFESVSFAYEDGKEVLSEVNFLVPAGKRVSIVGASGAGKTSILRLLLGHYRPASGRVLVDDQDVGDLDLRDLRSQIAVVTQNTILFNRSLGANIRFAREGASPEDVARAATRAQLEAVVSRFPAGLETMVGQLGQQLSGGEAQRVAIARAILRESSILLLDEPTSALDASTERDVLEQLLDLSGGRTTVIVTHRLALALQSDHVIVLNEGRVVEQGPPNDLIARDGVFARLWRTSAYAQSTIKQT